MCEWKEIKKKKQGRKILFMTQITFRHKFLRVLGLGSKLSSIFRTNEEPAQFKWHLKSAPFMVQKFNGKYFTQM
jgi:hypothetical protein